MSNKIWVILSNTNSTKNGCDVPFVEIYILFVYINIISYL